VRACIVWSQKFRKSEISLDTGIFSTKYNLNIYTENSFELPYILQAIKKSNTYIGYTKYIKSTPIENV